MKTRFIVFKLQIAHNNIKTVFFSLRLIIHEELFSGLSPFSSLKIRNKTFPMFGFCVYVFVPNVFISICIKREKSSFLCESLFPSSIIFSTADGSKHTHRVQLRIFFMTSVKQIIMNFIVSWFCCCANLHFPPSWRVNTSSEYF